MSGPARAVGAALIACAACGGADGRVDDRFNITADTAVDDAANQPGTVFRHGPATPEAVQGPVYSPVVRGDEGQVSIYQGYFVRPPCADRLRVEARHRGDTIRVRIYAPRDSAAAASCNLPALAVGYSLLVGPFEPGPYDVHLTHEGDIARETPLDTVYENVTIKPRQR